ncbi:signal transduction histidine kinase [Halohasta litchfieldiae]|jgi:signal transduction histidine kinase|uniref:histidine kinase n=1 Tax=Halohasta litchfieldiae TaxID=1073996 RepID=A0A1H6XZT3_9EURY|nr:hybrid sensor histidine kinase/response regulator [Halohasta litchfieldiae]ATW88093.1 signal transduction histidine kinase [Halohasta litchfieldiae]SEJ34531.1 Signal transduction histidine kinase [Halohasta litchfieldiae]
MTNQPINVLYVGGDREWTQLLTTVLEREETNIDLQTTPSVDRTRRIVARGNTDCLVFDCDLSRLAGIELLRSIRRGDEDLPFILCTRNGTEPLASEASSMGATVYRRQQTKTDQSVAAANLIRHIEIEQLRVRLKTVRRHNERLEEFTSVVAHDLRNPLTIASGSLELAMEDCDSDRLRVIERAHTRMKMLVADLLTLARDGTSSTNITQLSIAELCVDCWQNVDTTNATLNVTTDRSILADRNRLKQLFENLFRNAIEHGGKMVTVGTIDTGFHVSDDGPGIPIENRDHVFTGGYSTAAEGTGLGLQIVKQIVEAHGWGICVTEGTAGGARFEITGVD